MSRRLCYSLIRPSKDVLSHLEYQPKFTLWPPGLRCFPLPMGCCSSFHSQGPPPAAPAVPRVLVFGSRSCCFHDDLLCPRTTSWLASLPHSSLSCGFCSIQMLLHRDATPEHPPKQCPSPTSSALQGCHTIANLQCHSWPAAAFSRWSAGCSNARILFNLLLYP